MKSTLIVLATAFISFSASAAKYENWMGSAFQLNCTSTFERQERSIVSTIKANMENQGTDLEGVKSLEVYSQVQIKNTEARRKYIITQVLVDQAESNQGPMIVKGKHPITKEAIRIEIDTESQASSLFIGGKEQTYLKLECNVGFAG